MTIHIEDRAHVLGDRLRDRLQSAALLRCTDHDEPVMAVSIHVRENGWFDSVWTTCCDRLEQQAAAIVKARC